MKTVKEFREMNFKSYSMAWSGLLVSIIFKLTWHSLIIWIIMFTIFHFVEEIHYRKKGVLK